MLLSLVSVPYTMTSPIYRFHRYYFGILVGTFCIGFGIICLFKAPLTIFNPYLYLGIVLSGTGAILIKRTPKSRGSYRPQKYTPPQV